MKLNDLRKRRMTIIEPPQAINSRAEWGSAVSQIFNLRNVPASQRFQKNFRPAECNLAIQPIENLRYFAVASPRHALLHFQSTVVPHKLAFTGLFTT